MNFINQINPMKYLLIIFTCISTGCISKIDNTIIKGTFKGEIPKILYYTASTNGVCNSWFTEALYPDSLGNFIIKLDNSSPVFIKFLIGVDNQLIIEPGQQYDLEFNVDKHGKSILKCRHSNEMQDYYQGLQKVHPRSCQYFSSHDVENYHETKKSIKRDLELELNNLNTLLQNSKISKNNYNLIVMDRQVYYHILLCHLASRANLHSKQYSQQELDDIFEFWKTSIEEVDLSNPLVIQAAHIFDFFDLNLWYYVYLKYDKDEIREIRKKHRMNGLIHTHTINLAKEFIPKQYHEYYIATYIAIHSRQRRNQNEKEFIDIKNQYQVYYPNSQYLRFFEANINKIEENINKITGANKP